MANQDILQYMDPPMPLKKVLTKVGTNGDNQTFKMPTQPNSSKNFM